jgi:hypothetical protein
VGETVVWIGMGWLLIYTILSDIGTLKLLAPKADVIVLARNLVLLSTVSTIFRSHSCPMVYIFLS